MSELRARSILWKILADELHLLNKTFSPVVRPCARVAVEGHTVMLIGGQMAQNGSPISRRLLLQWSAGLAACFGATSATAGQLSPWPRSTQPMQDLTAESFLPYVGHTMRFARPLAKGALLSRTAELKLLKVDGHDAITRIESHAPANHPERTRASFSLVFELTDQAPLEDGLHRLVHSDFAGHALFVSEVSRPRPDGTRFYEAVFG
jgi:hypothetical protein